MTTYKIEFTRSTHNMDSLILLRDDELVELNSLNLTINLKTKIVENLETELVSEESRNVTIVRRIERPKLSMVLETGLDSLHIQDGIVVDYSTEENLREECVLEIKFKASKKFVEFWRLV